MDLTPPTMTSNNSSRGPLQVLQALARMEIQSPQYCRSDYLDERRLECAARGRPSHLNEVWRTKVCEWFYRVIDSHRANLSREIVFISVNIVDRFLAKTSVDVEFDQEESKSFFQLVTLTSLYIGVKVFYNRTAILPAKSATTGSHISHEFTREENDVLTIQSLLRLSTSGVQADDIRVMTLNILTTISWSIRPLSPLLFVRYMLAVVTDTNKARCKQRELLVIKVDLYETCRFLCELSACDYFFVRHSSSSVALASILVAMDQHREELHLDQDALLQDILSITGNVKHSTEINLLKTRLEQIHARSTETSTRTTDAHDKAVAAVPAVMDQVDSDARVLEESNKRRRIVSSEDLKALWGQS